MSDADDARPRGDVHKSDECYWCGDDVAESGSIKVRMNEGEPKRETCPGCFRDWPPEEVADAE